MRKRGAPIGARVIVVTGGARGIGAAIAQAAARSGARAVIGDVDVVLARATAAAVGATAFELDVASRASWETFVAAVEEHVGPIDVLVNNAGIMPVGPFLDETDATRARQLAINLDGVLLGCHVVLPGMLDRGRGHLVNVASQAGKAALGGLVTYCATKHAVVGLSHGLDDELRNTPVSVTCVLPGVVNTELSRGLPQTRLAPQVEPEEIAAAVLDAIRRPRREVWLPRSGVLTMTLMRWLPARMRARIRALLRVPDPLLEADTAARAGYEARIAAIGDRTDVPEEVR